jgi:hypothetical protein
MIAVPAGKSHVEVRYTGSALLRICFWISCIGWIGVPLWGLGRTIPSKWTNKVRHALSDKILCIKSRINGITWRTITAAAVVTTAIILIVSWGRNQWLLNRNAIGPIRIEFVLPRGETNRQQPLVVTGKPGAALFVYVVYHDDQHVRIGVDSWGVFGFQSDPIHTDYFAEHTLIVDAGALYPENHPVLTILSESQISTIRTRLRVIFDGQVVVDKDVNTHTSTPAQISIGENPIGGSSCEPTFAGEILRVERLSLKDKLYSPTTL